MVVGGGGGIDVADLHLGVLRDLADRVGVAHVHERAGTPSPLQPVGLLVPADDRVDVQLGADRLDGGHLAGDELLASVLVAAPPVIWTGVPIESPAVSTMSPASSKNVKLEHVGQVQVGVHHDPDEVTLGVRLQRQPDRTDLDAGPDGAGAVRERVHSSSGFGR
jgi:hypothetical protein